MSIVKRASEKKCALPSALATTAIENEVVGVKSCLNETIQRNVCHSRQTRGLAILLIDLACELVGEDSQNIPESVNEFLEEDELDHTDTQPQYVSKSFFPSHYGITFSTEKSCTTFKIQINFGNYTKANFTDVKLPYHGGELHLLEKFGLNQFVQYDNENKVLFQVGLLQRIKDKPFYGCEQILKGCPDLDNK